MVVVIDLLRFADKVGTVRSIASIARSVSTGNLIIC